MAPSPPVSVPPLADGAAPLVEVRGVGKRFGGVHALAGVDLRVARGQVHGLVGENGAGKSTLGKIIAGVLRPDAGAVLVDGRPVHYRSPHDALRDGITIVAQELALVPQLSVLENVFLGVESRRWGVVARGALRRRYAALDELGFGLAPDVPVWRLSVADQQKVEILRAAARAARLIVMDEPTASLTEAETAHLKELVRALRGRGTSIIFVSHALGDVLSLCDTVTVLRDGRLVRTGPAAAETPTTLVTAMVGRSLDLAFPPKTAVSASADVALSATGLTVPGKIANVSLSVRRGEIVGLAGLIGSGRSEVARAIFGAEPAHHGVIELGGRRVAIRSPRDAIRQGIALVPEDRKGAGLVMGRSLIQNVTLPHLPRVSVGGVIDQAREDATASRTLDRVGVRAESAHVPVATLSGGNQQKTLFAKWLYDAPRLLIVDEPTRGVDVGAKRTIYELLVDLARGGMGVLVISSELDEVIGLAHRIYVMRGGTIVAEVNAEAMRRQEILHLAFGYAPTEEAGTLP